MLTTTPSLKLSEVRLDLLRSIAAMLVLVGHWRILTFQDYPNLVTPSRTLKLFYFVTGLGRPSVIIFFVLSGYLVTGSAMRSVTRGRWTVGSYLSQRITRLIVVLLPALVLCWFWDTLGFHFFPHGLYDGSIHTSALSANLTARRDVWTFLQNCVFLQGITAKTYGSDDPLWSLSYEFCYYIFLIPLICIYRRQTLRAKLLCAAFLSIGLWFVGPQISLYFSIWLLGAGVAVLARLKSADRFNRLSTPVMVLLLMLTLFLIRARNLPEGFPGYLVLGCVCALFVYGVVRDETSGRPTLMSSLSKNVAGWSYSLYLLHMPFLVFAASLFIRDKQWYPDARHLPMALLILSIVTVYSYVISLVTEKRTQTIRNFLATMWICMESHFSLARRPSGSSIRPTQSGDFAAGVAPDCDGDRFEAANPHVLSQTPSVSFVGVKNGSGLLAG